MPEYTKQNKEGDSQKIEQKYLERYLDIKQNKVITL